MILTFGSLAVLSSMIFPGLIIQKKFFEKEKFLNFLPFIFATSLIINWIIIFTLTSINFYISYILYFIIITEVSLLLYFYAKSFNAKVTIKTNKEKITIFQIINFLFVTITFYVFYSNVGNIYTEYDAIVTYNGRWAGQWFENSLPNNSGMYPQLLTSNMSLSNVLTKINTNEMQFFSYFLCLSFVPITSMVASYVARVTYDQRIYLANILFLILLGFPDFTNVISQNGYMDIPVTCFTIIAIGLFVAGWSMTKKDDIYAMKLIVLSIACAAGAAAIKQSGMMIAILSFPAIIYWSYTFKKSIIKILIILILIHICVYGFWYFTAILNILDGISSSEFSIVQSQFSHLETIWDRVFRAYSIWPHYFYMVAIALFSLSIPYYRWFGLICLPGIAIWSLFFSFDYRNFQPVLPFVAISFSGIIYFLLSKLYLLPIINFKFNFSYLQFFNKVITSLIIFTTTVLFIYLYISDIDLYERNEYKRRLIMPIEYSEAIYKSWSEFGEGRIITSQKYYIARLPRMPHRVVEPYDFEIHSIENEKKFDKLILESNAKYLLVSDHQYFKPSKKIEELINQFIIERVLVPSAKENNTEMYYINK